MKRRGKISNKIIFIIISFALLVILGLSTSSYTAPVPNPGHGGDTILISVNGTEKTLQQAIDNGDFNEGNQGSSGNPTTTTTCWGAAPGAIWKVYQDCTYCWLWQGMCWGAAPGTQWIRLSCARNIEFPQGMEDTSLFRIQLDPQWSTCKKIP